nr:hypothetical protein [Candidatus Cloacimonadota bacterium]
MRSVKLLKDLDCEILAVNQGEAYTYHLSSFISHSIR